MILDALLAFSNVTSGSGNPGDSPTAIASTPSTNQIDLGLIGIPSFAAGGGARDIGIGDDPAMKILVQVVTAFTGTTGTLSVSLQGAQDNGSGAPGAFSTWYTSQVYTLAQVAVVGARLMDMDMPRPPLDAPMPRFLQLTYNIATAVMTGGTLKAFLVLDRHDIVEQASGFLGGYPPGVIVAN